MKKESFAIIIVIITILSVNFIYALSPCQSGNLKTSVHKNYQMLYTAEDFIQLENIDALIDVNQL